MNEWINLIVMLNQQYKNTSIHQRIIASALEACPKIESLLQKCKFLSSDKLLGQKGITLPILICLLCVYYATGCSTTKNYAPVRNYHRNPLNDEKYYEVKQDDTLYSIGFRSGNDYKQLAIWNKIPPPFLLKIGQKIQLFQSKQIPRKTIRFSEKTKKIKTKNKPAKKTLTISNDNKKVLKFYWQWPLKGLILKPYSKIANKGIDIAGKIGQKVKSAASGKVVYSGAGLAGYGNLLIIKHNILYLSAYANNSRLLVKEGDVVKKGQVIAEVGRIGVKKASLHFEIRKNGKPVNPLRYLPRK